MRAIVSFSHYRSANIALRSGLTIVDSYSELSLHIIEPRCIDFDGKLLQVTARVNETNIDDFVPNENKNIDLIRTRVIKGVSYGTMVKPIHW